MKSNRVTLVLVLAIGAAGIIWFPFKQRKRSDQNPASTNIIEAKFLSPAAAVQPLGQKTSVSKSNQSHGKSPPLGSALSDSAIRDGQQILNAGVPDFHTAYRKLTNSGVEPDQAKSLLRPILWHLSYIATCNRVISDADHSETEFLERIRQDTTRTVEDREATMDILAVTNRQFRENWMAKRQVRMEAFSQLVADLKVDHPEDLLRDLLLVQPSFPPPDPPPP